MPQIQFKKGVFVTLVPTRTFAIGSTGVNARKGQPLMFDGTTVDVGGDQYSVPNLRGAVTSGWLIPEEDYDSGDPDMGRPQSANIQVRHPTNGGNPMDQRTQSRTSMITTESDEREVMQVRPHADRTRQANASYRRGESNSIVESQDGIPVRRLKTPSGERAKQTRTVLDGSGSVGAALRDAEVTITPGQGTTQEEMLARMDEQTREEYLNQKAALRAHHVDEEAPKVVNRVAKSKAPSQREGISAPLTVGGGVETADLQGLDTGTAKSGVTTVEGMTFRTLNGPERPDYAHPRQAETKARPAAVKVKEASSDVRRMVAKQLCPDFPDNYDFTTSDKKKLARLQADYEDRFDVLKAVFAAESDAFKGLLIQEFPEAFAS